MTQRKSSKLLFCVLAAVAVLFGGSTAASATETLTANFNSGLPEGWSLVGDVMNADDRARSGKGLFSYSSSTTDNYVVTEPVEGNFEFYARAYNKNRASEVIVYEYSADGLGQQLYSTGSLRTTSTPTWSKFSFTLPRGTQLAIALNYAALDDVTYTPYQVSETPTLTIDGFASGDSYDFGGVPVSAGTAKTFTLNNIGKKELTISSISVTGDFLITEGSDVTAIASQASTQLTIATPDHDTEGTLTITSDDANSPFTIQLKSIYRAPAPIMNVSPLTIAFGRVAADATQDIAVSNTGDAELVATIASTDASFTVSKETITVAAGGTETFSITYHYDADAYGLHEAAVTITPNSGEAAVITASAYVQDPNIWTEDFSANALPDGWQADASWTFSDGVAHAVYGNYSTGYQHFLTTPALRVTAGASMTFQYRATSNYVKMKIEMAKDGGSFSEYKTSDWLNASDEFATFTIDGLESGSYQFRFANDDYDLDNFEGFQLDLNAPTLVVTPTNDAAFGKVSTQPAAKTYTITNGGTGTLEGIITSSDESVFAVSKADFSLEAGESTTFEVNLMMSSDYGAKSATITIHPTAEGLDDVIINATATLLDPNVWSEDFDEGELPTGWTTTGWTVGTTSAFDDNTTPMALAPQSTTEATLVTPRLQAKEGDVLTWDAYLRWSDEALVVEYSDDNQTTWHTIYSYQAADEEQGDKYHKQMSFTAPADGLYHLRFTARYQNGIDNLCGFQLAPDTSVKEIWHISYTFHHMSDNDEELTEEDIEDIEVVFDGDDLAFNFPNPITGNAWMRGSKYDYDGPTAYLFPLGQYISRYSNEDIYYCGGSNDTLTDMMFFYDEEEQAFYNFEHILLNGSTTAISLWAYFSDVVIYKNEKPVGIADLKVQKPVTGDIRYDLTGRRVSDSYKGIVIQNGKKYLIK
ncbi:MAG: choice-of-anchor D domain-containing protein [Bacteroidaceae bacterium]|nr:choice-of-anchor D domain-containing protein [Bacteroidaceae bacterium]